MSARFCARLSSLRCRPPDYGAILGWPSVWSGGPRRPWCGISRQRLAPDFGTDGAHRALPKRLVGSIDSSCSRGWQGPRACSGFGFGSTSPSRRTVCGGRKQHSRSSRGCLPVFRIQQGLAPDAFSLLTLPTLFTITRPSSTPSRHNLTLILLPALRPSGR